MIEIQYTLQESDFLELHLYYFKSEGKLKRLTLITWIGFLLVIGILSGILIWKDDFFLVIVLGSTAALLSIFHGNQMKRVYQKHFKKTIKIYESRFGQEVYLKITESQLHVESIAGSTNINFTEVIELSETQNHFFIKLKTQAIIIPKTEVKNIANLSANLKDLAKKLNVNYRDDPNWKW
ncbi:hypothetical protein [Flavobacterium sp. GCM10023249]|uniref:hypothetical protein n=1 Tax=unclassified Flavobacterium TaxID=196869 RepID=UPI0036225291